LPSGRCEPRCKCHCANGSGREKRTSKIQHDFPSIAVDTACANCFAKLVKNAPSPIAREGTRASRRRVAIGHDEHSCAAAQAWGDNLAHITMMCRIIIMDKATTLTEATASTAA
jgi:hypothetical protein